MITHIAYNTTSGPATEPLTLAELKERVRELSKDFDDELTDLMKAAREQLEYDTHRRFITQTVAIVTDDFPSTEWMDLRIAPISAVTSIAYTDSAGDAQTFSSASYNTDFVSTPPRVRVVDGVFWPAVDDIPNAVTVTVTAGYGAASAVPASAKAAIVEHVRMNFGSCDGNPEKFDRLVGQLAWSAVWKAL